MNKFTKENYQAALLGLAVGDALGATTENMWVQDIEKDFGIHKEIIGQGWLCLKAGQVTDDTDMTMATVYGFLNAQANGKKDPVSDIGKEFIKWIRSHPVDVGRITYEAIQAARKNRSWSKGGKIAHEILGGMSAGNGSLMRILPVALRYHNDIDEMTKQTLRISRMTHFDSRAVEACQIYNRIAKYVIDGGDLKDAIRLETKYSRYASILKRNPSDRPSGYVVNTFEWVLRVLWISESYEEVIVRLANLGSDSDTTAAIAGGLAGLYYGLEAIPERLSSKIIRKDEILKAAADLFEMVSGE